MTVYIDILLFLNFITDYLLLLSTNRLSGFPSSQGRLLLAAGLGSLYGGLSLLPGLQWLQRPLSYFLCLAGLSILAFGWGVSTLRRGALFFLLSMALGGMALALQQARLPVLIFSALGLWLLTRASFGGAAPGSRYLPVSVELEDRTVSFTALVDTGNRLRDPVTGEPVLVVGPQQARQLTGLTLQQLLRPLEVMKNPPVRGLRLIPCRTIGTENGLLLGRKFSKVTLGSRCSEALLAFAPVNFGSGQSYEALTGGY